MLSFASEYLPAITGDRVASIAAKISPADVLDFQRLEFPGRNRTGWTYPGSVRRRGVHLGSLYWPTSASRFGVCYLLATDANLANIRANLQQVNYTPGTGYNVAYGPGKLVLSEEDHDFKTVSTITATMFMLPVRPLSSIQGMNGMYLVTLVDDRYWWWWRDSGNVEVEPGETSWGDLFDQIAQALGISITYDPIPAAYLEPGVGLTSQYEQTPLLFDAVAYNCGQRVVVDLDGTVHSYNQANSQTINNDNITGLAFYDPSSLFIEGGGFILQQDRALLLPSDVRVTFPQSVSNVAMGSSYAVDISLSSLGVAELGTVGNGNRKTFHDTRAAEGPTQSPPTNAAELSTLATQIAKDWLLYQLGPLDAKFQGVVDWDMEGLSDSVEWTYVKGEVSTRVYRPAWNDLTEELLHGPAPVEPPCWIKVTNPTLQTIHLTGSSLRTVNDAYVSNEDAVLVSVSANFTEADIGASVVGSGIPNGTTILDVISASQAMLSQPVTQTVNADSVTITQTNMTIKGYAAIVSTFSDETGVWTDGTQQVWFVGGTNEAPQPLKHYQCWLMGEDVAGLPIFSGVPGAALAIINSPTPNAQGYYDATLRYFNGSAWASGPNLWLLDGNA